MNNILLEIKNLSVSFGNERNVVDDISFKIKRGETVAIVGESGSGKSVTALSTVDLLPDNAKLTGSIKYKNHQLLGASEKVLQRVRGNDISFIFQEPMTSLNPLHTISKQLRESINLHQNINQKEANNLILTLIEKVGIRDPEKRLNDYPHQLSGGQRQRVMIAMALANQPDLLIADEPTTALDVTIQAQILTLIKGIQQKEGMGLLFITHDLGIVQKIADFVCVMQAGKIVEAGATREIFNHPTHKYTKMLLSSELDHSPLNNLNFSKKILETHNLKVWFPIKKGLLRKNVGNIKALNSASFKVCAGETLGIVGESGSGKTTLGLAIMRLISSSGNVSFAGKSIDKMRGRNLKFLRRDIQMIFQDPYGSLSPRMTIGQIISEGLVIHSSLSSSEIEKKVLAILIEVGLETSMVSRYPHEFSGGQRQRIAIARSMILKPKLVILDEPTSALDKTVQVQIVKLLRDLQQKYGLAYIFISHDLKVVRALSHNVIVMNNGDIVETGEGVKIFNSPESPYTKSLINAAFGLAVK
ncbi:ABC transporter ATP-binding protein [Paracoccaceae bacterium]|nr:ABC transporter ATP-binding protein [Paracoccaceae bacterium]